MTFPGEIEAPTGAEILYSLLNIKIKPIYSIETKTPYLAILNLIWIFKIRINLNIHENHMNISRNEYKHLILMSDLISWSLSNLANFSNDYSYNISCKLCKNRL